MTTLLKITTPDGKKHTCNASCHNANHPKCTSPYKKSKSKGLVDWGPLGDTDEEAEETLNRIFDSWG